MNNKILIYYKPNVSIRKILITFFKDFKWSNKVSEKNMYIFFALKYVYVGDMEYRHRNLDIDIYKHQTIYLVVYSLIFMHKEDWDTVILRLFFFWGVQSQIC